MNKRFLIPDLIWEYIKLGSLVVGSQAECYALKASRPTESDWDIMVPYCKRRNVMDVIPSNVATTKHRGWRFAAENISIDIWPDDLAAYFTQATEFLKTILYAVDFVKDIVYSAEACAQLK